MPAVNCYKYRISGQVQGVAFRYYTKIRAEELEISGYVRNLSNGDVEVVASGETESIEKFEKFLNTGPSSAIVSAVKKEDHTPERKIDSFDIIK